MGRVALAKGIPALPLLRVAKFSPIVYDRELQLPPCRTSAPPPTPQSRSSAPPPSPSPSSLAGTSRSRRLHPVPGDWVLSLGTGIFFEVIEAVLIDKLNSADYTENRYSAQLYFRFVVPCQKIWGLRYGYP